MVGITVAILWLMFFIVGYYVTKPNSTDFAAQLFVLLGLFTGAYTVIALVAWIFS